MTTVSQEAREAEVTQADRAAAQAILDTWFNRSVIETILARHRQSAERGEVVAWMYERKANEIEAAATLIYQRRWSPEQAKGWVETPLYAFAQPEESGR